MNIEIKAQDQRIISNYKDAIKFLEENNWDLNVINAIPKEKQNEFLKLSVQYGHQTIAHKMVHKNHEFTDPEIFDSEILKLADDFGRTVAHEMVRKGCNFTDPEILKLADISGRTVAHEMVLRGYKFDDPDILKLANNDGWTVAHEMAWNGYKFTDPEILKLAKIGCSGDLITVADICDKINKTDKFNRILQETEEQENDEEKYEMPVPF